VVQKDGTSLPGATIVVQGTTLGASSDSKGMFSLENVPDDATLVVSFVGYKSKVVMPVFVSDMTIIMMKDTVRLKRVGIPTPPPPPPPPPTDINGNIAPPPPPPSVKIRSADGKSPLIVVDGVIKDIDVEYLDPETIASINVIKDKTAIDKYGDKGKDGVVEVATKKGIQSSIKESNIKVKMYSPDSMRLKGGKEPLIIVDGVIMDISMNSFDPNSIESITVLKDQSATALYGDIGKNGVILVKTKDKSSLQKMTDNDTKVKGFATDKKSEKEMFVVVEEMPEFPGGNDAMRAWIAQNMIYPADATKAKISGMVEVNFLVSSTGKVKNVTVSKPVYLSLDAEAIRVVSSMPDWKPGTQAGKPVDVQMKVPMTFILRETKTPVEKN
jgi:TonB family protein